MPAPAPLWISVVCYDAVKAATMQSLWFLCKATKELDLRLHVMEGLYTPYAREETVDFIQKESQGRFEAIIFIDSDMGFLPQSFEKLVLLGRSTKAVVGAFYPARRKPDTVVGSPLKGGIQDTFLAESPIEADHLGAGFLYIPSEVFTAVPKPWFQAHYVSTPTGHRWVGEDVHFCHKVRDHMGPGKVWGVNIPGVSHAFEISRNMTQ